MYVAHVGGVCACCRWDVGGGVWSQNRYMHASAILCIIFEFTMYLLLTKCVCKYGICDIKTIVNIKNSFTIAEMIFRYIFAPYLITMKIQIIIQCKCTHVLSHKCYVMCMYVCVCACACVCVYVYMYVCNLGIHNTLHKFIWILLPM